MNRRSLLAIGLAVLGCGAVVVGIYQELLHVAPAYDGTIVTGWGGDLNHEERLLARIGAVGVAGAVATYRWRRLAAVSVAAGGVVLFYALRAVLHYAREPGLYTTVRTDGGTTTRFVLGAEPFLLVAGGLLLVGAGICGWYAHADGAAAGDPSPSSTV